jgi:hypothetical protein
MEKHQPAPPTECFPFTWRRRVKGPGFQWIWGQKGKRLLVGPPEENLQPYEPLVEETGLFLTFANLASSEKAFLRFANTYGRLGTYHVYQPELGEPLEEWRMHHCRMRFLAKLRQRCNQAAPKLSEIVKWRDENEVEFRFPRVEATDFDELWRHGVLRRRLQNMKGLPLFQRPDLVGLARWFLCFAVDDWLQELQKNRNAIAPRMVLSEGKPQLVFSPSNLLGAMVYQLATALHGSWPFQECAYCRKFFRLAPGVNRANRRTCSNTCKQYLHNRRVANARQLHAQGRTAQQIARELNVLPQGKRTSADIVKKWTASA